MYACGFRVRKKVNEHPDSVLDYPWQLQKSYTLLSHRLVSSGPQNTTCSVMASPRKEKGFLNYRMFGYPHDLVPPLKPWTCLVMLAVIVAQSPQLSKMLMTSLSSSLYCSLWYQESSPARRKLLSQHQLDFSVSCDPSIRLSSSRVLSIKFLGNQEQWE